jgi:hypothetical protein
VTDPRLDSDTAEWMLRGEPTGPPRLSELLAAAVSEPARRDSHGEEAAVAAFRASRSLPHRQPHRLSALVSLKAALIGMLLILAGGITAAAAAQHLPGPLGNEHPHRTRTPATPRTVATRTPPRPASRPTPHQHAEHGERSPETAQPEERPHHTKKPRGNASRSNAHKTDRATVSVPVPSAGPLRMRVRVKADAEPLSIAGPDHQSRPCLPTPVAERWGCDTHGRSDG